MNPEELPLRDIHLPEPVGWWPPAPGWWIVAALVVILVVAGVWAWRRRAAWRRSAVFIAQREFALLRSAWLEHGDTQRLVSDVSTWLRRAAISIRSRHEAAALTDARWWQYLDELAGQPVFGPDGGRLLTEAPYRNDAEIDGASLVERCERWLSAVGDRVKRGAPA